MKRIKLKMSLLPIHFIVAAFCISIILPFILVVSVSLTGEKNLTEYGFRLLPVKIDFNAYKYAFENVPVILNAYKISIIYGVLGTFLSVMTMSMVAYSLSRPYYKLKRGLSFFLFFTMLFSGGLTPSYILITQYLKLQDTIWVLLVPGLVNVFHVIMIRTFFQQIPESLFESAKIDGASEFRIFFNIALQLSTPVLATVAFMGLVGRWNDWFAPKLYISKSSLYPIQYILQSMLANVQFAMDMMKDAPNIDVNIQDIPRENLRMAMMVITAGPMLLVFPFFQKYFVRGLTVGSVKG